MKRNILGQGIAASVALCLIGSAALAEQVGIGFLLQVPAYRLLKQSLKRRRPCAAFPGVDFTIAPPDHYSLPSGHTAGAFLIFFLCLATLPAVALPVLIWAVLVAYSRVHAGVHFPADVFAGILLAWLSSRCALMLFGLE